MMKSCLGCENYSEIEPKKGICDVTRKPHHSTQGRFCSDFIEAKHLCTHCRRYVYDYDAKSNDSSMFCFATQKRVTVKVLCCEDYVEVG